MIGTYGDDTVRLDIGEREGRLYADGAGFLDTPLTRDGRGFVGSLGGRTVRVEFLTRDGGAAALVGGAVLRKRDFGAEVQERIRAGVRTDIGRIREQAMRMEPPVDTQAARPADLVDLAGVVPDVQLDIRYASTNNFMGIALYDRSAAFMQRPAAEALARVAGELRGHGFGIKVHDAYRPWHITRIFWDATPASSREFVADPSQGSRHNRGCAIDLTLYDLKTGEEIEMPGRYDEMSPRSYSDYRGGTSRQRWARDLLRREMERQGFIVYPQEWWHFDYRDWRDYPVMNAALTELELR